ncbi:Flavin-containing monooxygenase FMO GS-OX3 [Psilocybe cubensis]|nr:Flavin-containing monooxygenase FMO GS-OX3 [Psilocybe cubensis]KAH9487022.1 Flavin-containing monooxygenase FMO GS-OX3 [Psilocybe cubensis]
MVNIQRLLFSFLSSTLPSQVPLHYEQEAVSRKSVAIVGAGSAGLAMLKTFTELDTFVNNSWEVVLFEEREHVGGVWLPDYNDVHPPEIPETPLYPLLHTNTPVPSMAYPGFPFPPGTPLYPSHEYIEAYHRRYAQHYKLLDYISFNHKIQQATWSGSPENGYWNLTVTNAAGHIFHKKFDHLVVASGNHHIPRIPVWKGQDKWLSNAPQNQTRKILHSVYYRKPEAFTGLNVLIVGNGASGRDAASQILDFATTTVVSVRHDGDPLEGVIIKPEISHFTADEIVFVDGTTYSPDVVLLGTGYEQRKPFLTAGGELAVDPAARNNSDKLVTNLKYIFPLYRHILSLSPSYPTNALAFIGLPTFIANCPSDIAQSLFAAHAIINPSILPSRQKLLKELEAYEAYVRANGRDPYINGHQMLTKIESSDYQDELVEFLKDMNAIPRDGKKFVEEWRRDIFEYQYLKRGWKRIEELGTGQDWTKGVRTESQWADLMKRVNDWQKRWEDANGIEFRADMDLVGYFGNQWT